MHSNTNHLNKTSVNKIKAKFMQQILFQTHFILPFLIFALQLIQKVDFFLDFILFNSKYCSLGPRYILY